VKLRILLAAGAIALTATPAAHAAGWKQVTASGGSNIDQVSPVRTADGVLHVAWKKDGDLFHTAIGPDGKIRTTSPIVTGWASTSDPALTAVGGGLRAIWGGIRSTETTDPNQDLNTALSTDGGATWALQPGTIIPIGAQAYASDTSATTLPNGTVLASWFGTAGTWVHAGIDPATPNFNFQAPLGGYGNDPGIAADRSGSAMLAWFSGEPGPAGILAQGVNGDGSPAGSPQTMPGTTVMVGGPSLSRTPIVARPKNGGYYIVHGVGYPTASKVRVWRVGSTSTTLLDTVRSSPDTAVAADAKGRLWAVWTDNEFGDEHVIAARSNRAATRFGQPVDVGAVKKAHSTYSVDASAVSSGLDVLAVFGVNDESTAATYLTRILPGLTLTAKKQSGGKVTFTVTDAGDPVKGATVKAGGKSDKTDAKGRAVLTLKGKPAAQATATGYTPATLKLK
jgi:hypothetical protein